MNDYETEQGKAALRQKELDLTPNQCEFAESLGVDWQSADSLAGVLQGVEHELGQRNIQELIRWFLLSVYRHDRNGKWERPQDSDLSEDEQYRLTAKLADSDEYKLSLLTVLKDSRCRYTLLRFGKSRNPARRILSNTTKAFKQAQQLLREQELLPRITARKAAASVEERAGTGKLETSAPVEGAVTSEVGPGDEPAMSPDSGERPLSEQESVNATAVNRRAARRGFQESRGDDSDTPLQSVALAAQAETEDDALSEEEFEELDKALRGAADSSAQRWSYNTNEERFSLLLGVLAGSAACVLVLWLFY